MCVCAAGALRARALAHFIPFGGIVQDTCRRQWPWTDRAGASRARGGKRWMARER
jgi:hypothetical protein